MKIQERTKVIKRNELLEEMASKLEVIVLIILEQEKRLTHFFL